MWTIQNIATAVYIGTVGQTEMALRPPVTLIFTVWCKPMKHTISGRDERTLLKMIVCRSTDPVLGIHMIGCDERNSAGTRRVRVFGATKANSMRRWVSITAAEEFVTLRRQSTSKSVDNQGYSMIKSG